MFPAVKHFDPVIGIDTHIIMLPTPAGPVPTPVPHPFIGMMFDPMDYVPKLGATVFINGLPRGVAGSAVKMTPPHIPMGGPFAKPPGNEGELFMGSATVLVEGEPMGYTGLPVLSCQDIGMPAPLRPSKKGGASASLFLPTSNVMAIPAGAPVLIGGPPTIVMPGPDALIGPAAKLLGKTLRKARLLRKATVVYKRKMKGASRYLNQVADKVFDELGLSKAGQARNLVRRSICAVTGHPVDIATGKVFTDFVDLELPGPLPFTIERVWFSTSTYDGPLGHGWHASFDMSLAEDEKVVGVRMGDGRAVLFPALDKGESHFDARERLTLTRQLDLQGYGLLSANDGRTYRFAAVRGHSNLPLVSVEDRNGLAIHFHYDERGKLNQIVDAARRSWDLRYDASDRLSAIEGPHRNDPARRTVYAQYAYDGRGNLSEVLDAYGQPQRFVYERQLLVRETNRNGLSFQFEWDGRDHNARCTRTWGDDGIYDHKLTYDVLRNITTVENSLGYKTQYEHDGAMVRRTIDAYGNIRQTEYGLGYRVTTEIDELGQRTSFEYDERGNLLKSMTPDGAIVAFVYDEADQLVCATDALGGAWSFARDAKGRVVERKDPLERVTRYEYQGAWLVSVLNPAGGRARLGYDDRGNVEALGAADGSLTRFEHDLLGRVVAVIDAKGNVQRRELDALGRVQRVQEPDGNVRTLAYDAEGNVVHARDQQHDVRFSYQGMNRLASRSEAGTTVRFRYDTEEQLTDIVNEHGSVYSFKLGPTGEVDEEHGFDGLMRKYVRDRAGRVTRVERPGERFSEYVYDGAGRVTEVKYADGTDETFQYQRDGALIVASNSEGMLRFTRDALGRIVQEDFNGHTIDSDYDLLGMRVSMKSSLGAAQTIERNAMGDVLHVAEGKSGFAARFERDQLGLELSRTLPGGVRSRWQRDQVGRPSAHVVEAGEATLRALGYKWDVNDRLRMVIDGLHGPTEYRHDALGNLTSARYADGSAELRMPDAVGNLFRSEQRGDRKYGPAGQLLVSYTPEGETHYAYDPEGNLIEKREPSGALWRYEWNGAGMLAQVTRPDGSVVTFAYDALGRRVRKTYRGQTTRWLWDGNVPLHEWVEGRLVSLADAGGIPFVSAGTADKRREAELEALLSQGPPQRGSKAEPITWLFEPESFAPLARLCGGEAQSIVCDHMGTPVLMVDGSGARVWSASISVYGELRDVEGERFACPFRWPGQYEDVETGLYYNRFRYYDAEAGQYCSQDPIGLAGGRAVYGYVADPLLAVDPHGLSAKCGSSVNLASEQRTRHILHGDATGGGHLWPGAAGKTPFPAHWSGEKVMHQVSDISTDPASKWIQQTGTPGSLFTKTGRPARFSTVGEREGVRIKVVLEPAGEGIITAHPLL